MSAALPDLTLALGRVTEETRSRLDAGVGEVAAWVAWILAGAPGAKGCVVCDSRGKKELNHVAGWRHGELVVSMCIGCHRRFSKRQLRWDGRWRSQIRTSELDRALLVMGLLDMVELRADFTREPAACLAYAGRLAELFDTCIGWVT
jgi:hypothetical protein